MECNDDAVDVAAAIDDVSGDGGVVRADRDVIPCDFDNVVVAQGEGDVLEILKVVVFVHNDNAVDRMIVYAIVLVA